MRNNLKTLLGYLLEEETVSQRPFMLSLDNLVAHRDSLFDAYEHCVYRNRCSESSGPIVVAEIEDGKYQLIDGYHRLIEHLLDRGGLVPIHAILGGEGTGEYAIARGVDRWLGDASMRYGNLEDLTDEETLEGHANKRKNAKKGDLFENGVGGGEIIEENVDESALRGFSLDILKKETKRLKAEDGYIEDISYGLSQLAEKYDLPYMGRGSSRVVYALSTGKVLKISRDERGLAQTEAEVSVWTNPSTKEVAAQVFDFDPDFNWSVMEIARTFKYPDSSYKDSLEQELGIPTAYGVYFEIRDIVNELLSDRSDGIATETIKDKLAELPRGQEIVLRKRLEKYLENPHPFVNKIADLVHNNDLNTGDLVSDHFGKTADGRIVLIDYGLTDDVAQEFY